MNHHEKKPRRMYPPMYLALAILLMIGLHRVAPLRQIIGWPWRYLGVIPFAIGLWLVLWVNAIFRRVGTTIKPFEESSALVTQGPFRVSRNPIYLGMAIALFGVAVLLGSITPFLVVPAFAFLINARYIRAEEVVLAKTFGRPFDDYKERVRRWL
jgi:protein-S-isoprenylcysteine O-methyltransferase Ste14